jgi:formiminotetrahydrofolate cyclodeaminase
MPLPYPRVGDLTEQSLEEFLDSVGEDTPAPGGGTSSAVTTALAAALVEMAARLAHDEEEACAATRCGSPSRS